MTHTIRFNEGQWACLLAHLWARTDVETGAIVFAEAAPSESSASLAVRKIVEVPDNIYRVRNAQFIELDPVWMNQQCYEARRKGLSVFTVHTHLSDGPAWFSWADDVGDRRLMPALLAQMPERLHGALNVTRRDAVARVFVNDEFVPTRISVAGTGVRLFPNQPVPGSSQGTHARQELALGREGQARLATTRVGIVGLGGTGSVVAELLGRLGVRVLTLVDGDYLEESNFSRVLGSLPSDVIAQSPKTKIAYRELLTVAPDASVTVVEEPLSNTNLSALSECDVIFSCVDLLAPRALLNGYAYATHTPVIDMGSAFRVDDRVRVTSQGGKVVIIGPGRPCLWCWGDLDGQRIRVESLRPEERQAEAEHGYITGADVPQPSVVAFNATLAAAAVTEFVRLVTSFAGSDTPPDRINFDFARGTATRATGRSRCDCSFCGTVRG